MPPTPPTSRTHWGVPKRQRSISISDTGWDALGTYASEQRMTRSEVCERLFRTLPSAPSTSGGEAT